MGKQRTPEDMIGLTSKKPINVIHHVNKLIHNMILIDSENHWTN
jgi:hypothetical protein